MKTLGAVVDSHSAKCFTFSYWCFVPC